MLVYCIKIWIRRRSDERMFLKSEFTNVSCITLAFRINFRTFFLDWCSLISPGTYQESLVSDQEFLVLKTKFSWSETKNFWSRVELKSGDLDGSDELARKFNISYSLITYIDAPVTQRDGPIKISWMKLRPRPRILGLGPKNLGFQDQEFLVWDQGFLVSPWTVLI